LQIEGLTNVRDAGGWAALSGKRIKQGMIFRGSEMNSHVTVTSAGVATLKNQLGLRSVLDIRGDTEELANVYGEGYLNDQKFLDAVDVAIKNQKIATSLIQRKLSIGYGKAAKYIDVMESLGIVGEANGPKPREVRITMDEWHEMLARRDLD
jgi:DNA segregation ATPase FtsK/SpoIIIE-like protein